MQDLSEHQTFRNRVSVLQSCVTQGITQGNLKNIYPDFERDIAEIEESLEACLEATRILISRPNQFPGYRSVVLFGSLFAGDEISLYSSNDVSLVTVSSDGRLNNNVFTPTTVRIRSSPLSLEDAMKFPETNANEWKEAKNSKADINLFGSGSGIDSWFSELKYCLDYVMFLMKHTVQTEVVESIRKQVQNDFGQARHVLCNALDRDVLKIMRGTGLGSIREGRWLTGGDGVSSEIVLARKQAVCAYPILAKQFAGTACHSENLRMAIDTRTSLSDAIALHFRLGKEYGKVKRLQGMTWQRAACNPQNAMKRAWEIVGLPEGTVPKTRKQFRKLEVFREFGHSVHEKNLCQFMEQVSGECNPWKLLDRMEQTSGRNVADSVDFLARKLYVPVLLNKIGRIADYHGITPSRRLTEDYKNRRHDHMLKIARNAILSSFRTRELLDWSDRYHRNIARYEDRLVTIDLEQDWPGISGILEFGNGHVARELSSSKALKTQGRTEDHCVGGYLPFVLEGEDNRSKEAILIFSIEKDNKILSTAEIRCSRESCQSIDPETGRKTGTFQIRARVNENLARSNKVPSRDAVRIANQVARRLEQITPDAWQSYLDGLEYSRAEQDRLSGIDAQIRNCGFDPFDRVMMERVWTDFGPGLPKHLRKSELDEFIDDIPVSRKILKMIFGRDKVNSCDWNKIDDDGQKIVQEFVIV